MSRFILVIFALLFAVCHAADPVFFCKCFCGSNSTIFELSPLETKPCSNCTKQFCLDNVQDGICDGIADETCPSNDFRTTCFGRFTGSYATRTEASCTEKLTPYALSLCTLARDSYKDESIVWLFLALTAGLLFSAAVKPYYERWQVVRVLSTTTYTHSELISMMTMHCVGPSATKRIQSCAQQ